MTCLSAKTEKKKLLIFNQSGGYLTVDVANAALSHYSEVVLYYGDFRFMERKLDERIKFLKTVSYRRGSNRNKFFSWTKASVHLFFLLLFRYRGYHILYYTNPPISIFCSLIFSNPFSVVVYDIYPEALKTMGLSEGNMIYRIWEKLNRRVLQKARQTTTLSMGMKELIIKSIPNARVKVVPPWNGLGSFEPIDRKHNKFREKYGLEEKFIVMYSGNLGDTHPLEQLVELAHLLKNEQNISFVIIGEGTKKNVILELVDEYSLTNLLVLGFQDYEMFPHSLASADLGVVTLEKKASSLSVPSKTFNLLSVGAPLLCLASEKSELKRLVDRYKNGAVYEPDDLSSMELFVRKLSQKNEIHRNLSEQSLKAAKDFHFSKAKEYFEYV